MTVERCDRCKKDLDPSAQFIMITVNRVHDSIEYQRELCPSCGTQIEYELKTSPPEAERRTM
jgi:hypothetical protein